LEIVRLHHRLDAMHEEMKSLIGILGKR
jgi:hypothetical protein